jgi:hypothetical protein
MTSLGYSQCKHQGKTSKGETLMTGRELILYILENNLENEVVIKDGVFVWLMNEEEAAVKFDVGVATIKAWYICGMLSGTKIGDHLYFLRNVKDPRKDEKHEKQI